MFSNQTFLHLVIADEKDLYYTEDMLRLNLNQHIWLQAHKAGWKKVYFLTAEAKDRTFSIRTFGDCDAESFQPKGGLFKKKQSLGDWMLDKLKSPKESTAFVCSLQDFCTVMEGSAWEDTLLRMIALSAENRQKGILILTASVYADDLRDLLMQSPVFEKKKIGRFNNKNPNAEASLCPAVNTLRASDAPIPLYETLSHEMQSSIYFLSSFTYGRVGAMLNHMYLKKPKRLPQTEKESDELKRFLTDYLNCSSVRRQYLISSDMQGSCPRSFQELARWLDDEQIWAKLKRKTVGYDPMENHQKRPPLGYHKPDSLGASCMNLNVWTENHQLQGIMHDIRQYMKSPVQMLENRGVSECLRRQIVIINNGTNDEGTQRRCMELVKYGVQKLYCEPGSKKEADTIAVLKFWEIITEFSGRLYRDEVALRQQKNMQLSKWAIFQAKKDEDSIVLRRNKLNEMEALLREAIRTNDLEALRNASEQSKEFISRNFTQQEEQTEDDRAEPKPDKQPEDSDEKENPDDIDLTPEQLARLMMPKGH